MQVQQLMTPAPSTCGPDANLCEAVRLMWEGDFGVLPVTDDSGQVVGTVTDRDISIALGTRIVIASTVPVSEVMTRDVLTCHGKNDVRGALTVMRKRCLRRLPVVDDKGRLCGLLSLNDAILGADSAAAASDVLETLRAVCTHRLPTAEPLVPAAMA